MRIIIKNADFSSVSIGKVVEDLSFIVHNNVDELNEFFPNYNSGTFTSTTFYKCSQGSTDVEEITTDQRAVSDFVKVTSGMTLECSSIATGSKSTPVFVTFDANKATVASSFAWTDNVGNASMVVPNGIEWIKVQTTGFSGSGTSQFIKGDMPE